MHSLRRAALSSVFSATRAVAQRSSATPFASALISQYGRSQSVIKSSSIPVARFLSGTARVANVVEDRADDLAVEDAVKAAAETGSTSVEDEAPRYREGETGYGIFVRNSVFDVTEAQLAEHFERYGPIVKAAVARDARGLSRGFGFVFFNDQEAATRAVSEIDGSFWNGRRVNVQPRTKPLNKQRPRVDQPTTSIYIGNIPYETTDAELNRLFRGLENVDDVRVAVDRTTGWPRGFAHADFTDVESAVRAFNKLSGTTIGGRELRLDYAQGLSQRRRNPNTGGGPGTPLAGSS